MKANEFITEKWSAKYKRSINCSNPKGFSQKAHCAGRKKNESVTEAKESIKDQIEKAVIVNGGDISEYFVRSANVDKLGYSAKQKFGRSPDTGDDDFSVDYIGTNKGKPALWFYPLSYYLKNATSEAYANDMPYVWLVRIKPNAWLQPVANDNAVKQPAPNGKERVGILRKSAVPAAIFFKPAFDVVDKFYDYGSQHKRHGEVKGVAEGRENYNGLNLLLQKDDEELFVKASAGGKELGHVLFVIDGDTLSPQDLEVDERYRGHGIAKTMYDYVKSKGYKIRRSGQQTDAGRGFWTKHRPEQNFWEQGVAEGFSNNMSTEDMIAYLRQHHDKNLHQDYLNHITSTNSKFVLKNIPINSIKTELSGLDRAKVEQYKQMDFSKAPPIVVGSDGNILDGYHRATVAKALGIPTIRAYVGVKGQQDVAENFADGKVKGRSRPGRVKRAGASCAGSVTDLRAKAKKYSGEKAKMYHWCANMKAGKK